MAQPRKQRRSRVGMGPIEDDTGIVFEEYLLRRAVRARLEAERQLEDAVAAAITGGFGWAAIGAALGIPATVAEQRYGAEAVKAS
jgi:hypothetical protein